MKKQVMTALVALGITATPSFAIVGFGAHWGFDFSTSMTDTKKDPILKISDLKKDAAIPTNFSDSSFLFISREGFTRTPINFGGKVFVDVLPVEFEISVNMGIWQYDGAINYLDLPNLTADAMPTKSEPITIEKIGGIKFFGVDKTPYGKFQTDFTVKKTFKLIPIVKPSIGVGASAHFATPVLSSDLVKKALDLNGDITGKSAADLDLSNPDNIKKILTEITEGGKKPKVGMHIQAGIQVKPPVFPVGVYVDGKYIIMFDDIENSVGVTTKGFLVNAGIMFKI